MYPNVTSSWMTPAQFLLETNRTNAGRRSSFLTGLDLAQREKQFEALQSVRDAQVAQSKAQTALLQSRAEEQKQWMEDVQELPAWLREVAKARTPEELGAIAQPAFKSVRGFQFGTQLLEQKRLLLRESVAGHQAQGIAEAERQEAFRSAGDILSLKSGGYLSGDATQENLYQARFARSRDQAATIARQMGIYGPLPDLPSHTITQNPDGTATISGESAFIRRDGSLNAEAWVVALKPMAPTIEVPPGMEVESFTKGPPENRVTVKKKDGKSRDEWIRDTAADLAGKGVPSDQARREAEALFGGQPAQPATPPGGGPKKRVWDPATNTLLPVK